MTTMMKVYVNATRNICRHGDEARRRLEARKTIKAFLLPSSAAISDKVASDHLVADSMIDRFLEIEPPVLRCTMNFDLIIEEIERAYVLGLFFAALSTSVVTIERMLNLARIEIHKHVTPKIGELWDKGPTDKWQQNIDALVGWNYVSEELATELSEVYKLRCQYLHSGNISNVRGDAL